MSMTDDVLNTCVAVVIQKMENGDGIVQIPREFLAALELGAGRRMELAARYQFRSGFWELALRPYQ